MSRGRRTRFELLTSVERLRWLAPYSGGKLGPGKIRDMGDRREGALCMVGARLLLMAAKTILREPKEPKTPVMV